MRRICMGVIVRINMVYVGVDKLCVVSEGGVTDKLCVVSVRCGD